MGLPILLISHKESNDREVGGEVQGKFLTLPGKIYQLCDLILSSRPSYEKIEIERLSEVPKATQLLRLWA